MKYGCFLVHFSRVVNHHLASQEILQLDPWASIHLSTFASIYVKRISVFSDKYKLLCKLCIMKCNVVALWHHVMLQVLEVTQDIY
jgi:hypothetical protein